jgi:NADPH:quinone reductase-like Zn-dependent oxidoreductase
MSNIPEKMYGMVLTGHGGLDQLQWRTDLETPRPGPGEVLIKVGAASVNNTDINTRTAWYSKTVRSATSAGNEAGFEDVSYDDATWSGAALSFPHIQGADCCGVIVAVGPNVDPSRAGQRVMVRALQAYENADGSLRVETFGSETNGSFAQFTKARDKDAIKVVSDLADSELASFPCAFSTAEGMIQRVGLKAERVLITGASGGVGSAAIQLAKRRGAYVVAVSSREKADVLTGLGADEVLDRKDVFPPSSFDVVIDLVGGDRWPELVDTLVQGGRYVCAGAIAGPIVELDLRKLYLKDLTFFGCTHQEDRIFTDLVGYIENGEIRPLIAQTFDLSDLRLAQESFGAKSFVGKIVLRVEGQ